MAAATATKAKLPLDLNEESTGAPLGKDPKNPGRDSKVSRMGTASIPRLITEFAIPAILGMVVNGAYNVVDSIFLGQAMGEIGLSAATVANPIMIVFMAISMLIGNGGNALAALRLGEGRRVDAEISLGNTVLLSVVVSAIVGIAALNPAILDSLLTLSSATDDVRPYARAFLQIICFGFIIQCIGMGVNNFIRTAGHPNRALGSMLVGTGANIVLGYLFIIVLGGGMTGAGLATVCSWALSAAFVMQFFLKKGSPMPLRREALGIKWRVALRICALGVAPSVMELGFAVSNMIMNNLLLSYGASDPLGSDGALAVMRVLSAVGMFTIMPSMGIAMGAQPIIGYNYGARKFGLM